MADTVGGGINGELSAEIALVRAAQAGDRAAFEELLRRTARLIYARLYLETGNPHRAEDLAQETYLLAWRRLRGLDDPSRFRAWLGRIAQTVAIDSHRHESRLKRAAPAQLEAQKLDEQAASPANEPCESTQQQEDRQRALSALRSMPEEYRLPLMLRYLEGADYETIARQLALTNGSLRGLLQRGLKMLRERLQEKN